MTYNFPDTPTNGQQVTSPGGTYQYDGQKWLSIGGISGGVTSFNSRVGPVTLQTSDVTALGFVTQSSSDARYLPYTGGTLTGPLTLSGDPTAPLQAVTKRYVDGLAYLPIAGGTITGSLAVNGTLTTYNVLSMDAFTCRNWYPHTMEFGWDGSFVVASVDRTGNPGELASVSWVNGNFATQGWVNNNFATYGWVQGQGYATQSWVNGNFKNIGAYTPNQSVDNGASPTFWDVHVNGTLTGSNNLVCGVDVDCHHVITRATDSRQFSFWVSGSCYIRLSDTYDYGPIGYTCDASFKKDIVPSTFDGLQAIKDTELFSFTFKENDDHHPIGFVTQQLEQSFPRAVDRVGNTPNLRLDAMVAAIFDAIKQLDARMIKGGL